MARTVAPPFLILNGGLQHHARLGIVESLEMEIGNNIQELTSNRAAFPQHENGDDEMSATDLGMLLRRVSEGSTREVDNLIDELQRLRKKLLTDRDRIQSDITRHSETSQGVIQLISIISDNVKQLPNRTS